MCPRHDGQRPCRRDPAPCSPSVRTGRDEQGTETSTAGLEAIFLARERHPLGPGAVGMTSSDRVVPFVKANACGNDFLIIDGLYVPADLADFSRRICDRHGGVGADGVEWLFPAPDADVQARLFNADGSEAEISGNGTRCVAAYLCSERGPEQAKEKITIQTGAGLKTCVLMGNKDPEYEFEIDMGESEIGA